MTTPADPIPDSEIRDWANSTGRSKEAGARGRVSDALRREYEAHVAAARGEAPPATANGAAGAAESDSKPPRAARQERTPKPVRPAAGGALGKLRAWFSGTPQTGKAAKPRPAAARPADDRPRIPVVRLVERAWDRMAEVAEHVNVPVARTMQWQSPYFGVVTDDVVAGTPLDRPLQWAARVEAALNGIGSMVAMPIIVGMITAERNDPQVGGLGAVARQQALQIGLRECIDAQLEMFGSPELVSKITKTVEERTERTEKIGKILDMIFAPVPPVVEVREGATAEELAAATELANRNAAQERAMREAAAAVTFMVPAGPDTRGDAAAAAAASMAASADRAVQSQAAVVLLASNQDGILQPTIDE